eukprot:6462207-Amphidinium_carterae.1
MFDAAPTWTFRHKASETLRTLDRMFFNLDRGMSHMLGLAMRVYAEGTSPPACGDHWPIILSWQQEISQSTTRLAAHAVKHPRWHGLLHDELSKYEHVSGWRRQWATLQLAFARTVDKVSSLPDIDTSSSSLCYWAALRALRTYKRCGAKGLQKFIGRCKCWSHLLKLSSNRQLKALTSMLAESLDLMLQDELREPPPEEEDQGKRQRFLSKALACWRQKRYAGAVSVQGAIDTFDEARLLTDHWRPTFEALAPVQSHAFAEYDDYIRPLPWPDLRIDVGELAGLLGRLPRTAAGPDGISNEMLASAPAWVAPVLHGALHDILQGEQPPSSWHDALLVLLPKDSEVAVAPGRFRPLALSNTIGKVLSRYVLFQLAAIFDHLEPSQQ